MVREITAVFIDMVVQYRRTDPVKYSFEVVEPDLTLQDVTESALREVVGTSTLETLVTGRRDEIASRTQEVLQSTIDIYGAGITVTSISLETVNYPQAVQAAVDDAQKARNDSERFQLEADAYANDVVPKARGDAVRILEDARGYRDRVVADAQGEAARFEAEQARLERIRRLAQAFAERVADEAEGHERAFLEAGVACLIEKPLAPDAATAFRMAAAAETAGVPSFVGFNYLKNPLTRLAKQIVDSGAIGEVYRIEMVCSNWFRSQAYYDSGAWRGTWDGEGGGVLINQAPHHLDLFQWIGGLPKSVFGLCHTRCHKIEVEDTANFLCDYGDGKVGYVYASTADEPGGEQFTAAFRQHLLASHALVRALVPGMRTEGYGRIINVISGGMYLEGLALDDLNYEQGRYRGSVAQVLAGIDLDLDVVPRCARNVGREYQIVVDTGQP